MITYQCVRRSFMGAAAALTLLHAKSQGFVNTYGAAGADDGIGVVQTGSGFAFGLRQFQPTAQRHLAAVLHTSPGGADFELDPLDELLGAVFTQAITNAADGALFLAGSAISADSSTHDGFLLKRLTDGSIAWVAQPYLHGDEQYLALVALPDGGAIAAGVRVAANDHDVWVTRFGSDGSLIWSQAIGNTAQDEEAYAIAVQGTDVMVTGRQVNFGGTSDAFFARLDLAGNVIWTTSWGGIGDEIGRGLTPIGSGAFLMAGCTNSYGSYDATEQRIKTHVHLIAIDLNGDTLWTRALGDTLNDRSGWCLSIADNGDAIIGGERWEFPGESDALAYRVNASGTVVWERAWDLGKEERLLSVLALPDGFVAAGWTFDALSRQVLLVRRDPNGN
jgi:hypothetical protein